MSSPTTPHEKPIVGANERVRVVGHRDEVEVEARMDAGAARTCIDRSLAFSVGAGPLVGEKSFRSSTDDADRRPILEVVIEVNGQEHRVEASMTDRSNFETDLRLGRDVLQEYLIDVTR
jgi:hypothetical protein